MSRVELGMRFPLLNTILYLYLTLTVAASHLHKLLTGLEMGLRSCFYSICPSTSMLGSIPDAHPCMLSTSLSLNGALLRFEDP
jgi:hypothetical protein